MDFEPVGKRVDAQVGSTILEAAQQAGVEIVSVCGGIGTCERCQVQVVEGAYSPVTSVEEAAFTPQELSAHWRLACQAEILHQADAHSPAKVHIPPQSLTTPQRLQMEGLEDSRFSDRAFHLVDLSLDAPDLDDLRSDASRLKEALAARNTAVAQIRYPILGTFSEQVRAWDWRLRAVVRTGQVVAVLPAQARVLGLAVDIGTTKVAAYLVDLETGETLARQSAMNPQIHYGEDVVSRIFHCMEHADGRVALQAEIAATLNELVEAMHRSTNCRREQVVEAVVVGNTAMHHFFAGLPVQQLGLLPFVPAVSEPMEIPASQVGLKLADGASVYLPSNIAGYVGADHVAMMLATEAYHAEDTVMAVDIGTNTEISLVAGGRIRCCSCASGPAFEGAHLREGMRAAEGAIERVQIEAGRIHLYTIGGRPPVGICGSGILDAIAEMIKAGILDERGVLSSSAPGVRGDGRASEFVLAPIGQTGIGRDISINRRDIHEILLAKAAIRTGIEILLLEAGIDAGQIDRFIVAGAFGTYLDLRSAIGICMFPDLPLERFSQVGNAAGSGARQMLVSDQARQAARDFAGQMEYVELTIHPEFKNIFLQAMDFRKADWRA